MVKDTIFPPKTLQMFKILWDLLKESLYLNSRNFCLVVNTTGIMKEVSPLRNCILFFQVWRELCVFRAVVIEVFHFSITYAAAS